MIVQTANPPLPAFVPSAPPTEPNVAAEPHDTIDRLKHAFFDQKRVPGQQTEGSLFNKLTLGMVVAAGTWAAVKVAGDIASSPSLGVALLKVGVNGLALGAGYLAADLPSGLLHHWADNYADPKSKSALVRKFAKQAQRHHYFPGDLGHYSLSAWASPLSIVAWAPLAGVAALGLASPILSASVGLIGGMSVYGVFHEWSHTPKSQLPKHAKLMQKLGLAIDPKAHGQHHGMPWNSDYCIVHGHLNKPLNAVKFWPRYERAIYKLTGKAPESWNMPEYKAWVDGDITTQQYRDLRRDMIQRFRQTEFVTRREKWGIEG